MESKFAPLWVLLEQLTDGFMVKYDDVDHPIAVGVRLILTCDLKWLAMVRQEWVFVFLWTQHGYQESDVGVSSQEEGIAEASAKCGSCPFCLATKDQMADVDHHVQLRDKATDYRKSASFKKLAGIETTSLMPWIPTADIVVDILHMQMRLEGVSPKC